MDKLQRKGIKLSQESAAYVLPASDAAKSCGACRWFCGVGEYNGDIGNGTPHCTIVDNWPLPIRETGGCNRFEAYPVEQEESLAEEIADELAEALQDYVSETREGKQGVFERIIKAAKTALSPQTTVAAFKSDGDRWWAVYSNSYMDKEIEAFRQKAFDDYIARVETKQRDYPELWFWHIPLRAGKADFIARHNNMMLAAGTFYDTPLGEFFKEFYRKTKERFTVSHGFVYPSGTKVNGVYHYVDTFEISPIPASTGAEANGFTMFIGSSQELKVTKEQQEKLASIFGADKAAHIITLAEQADNKGAASGLPSFKGMEVSATDTVARAEITALVEASKAQTEAIKLLIEAQKAPTGKPKGDDDEESDGKKKPKGESGYADMKKELGDTLTAITAQLTANQQAQQALVTQVKALSDKVAEFDSYTPSIATKDHRTQVQPNDEQMEALKQAVNGGVSNEFNTLFPMFAGNGQGGD